MEIPSQSRLIFITIIRTLASLPDVREEVIRNYEDNLWWPKDVSDWRLRMVIAGWGNRVSYNMIETYRKVITQAIKLGYDRLCEQSDSEMTQLLQPIGLYQQRLQYFRNITVFIHMLEQKSITPQDKPNDELILEIAQQVKGASYKVAQCAALYLKGYHCGIIPVDSGLKDMLGPCIGFKLPKGPIAHEVMRKLVESIIREQPEQYYQLARGTGYGYIVNSPPPTWWVHLVLVYFKRLYCNQKAPQNCPLRQHPTIEEIIGTMCSRTSPFKGRPLF
jgi:hypothetical protein